MEALTKAQPRELEASEIDVRLGATWLDPDIIQKFMTETFQIPYYLRHAVKVRYSPYTAEWRVEGKTATGRGDIISSETYGTSRANAYKILEETLNLKDVRIYDTIEDADGKPKRVLNKRETMLAQQKQQVIKDAFANWVWQDPQRRIALVKQYNELFNSTRPREYDGSHIKFVGMNPEITLREHQRNAIAHVLYGGNTLLAHEVGAGKTYEMAASAMEAKRLGLCQKSLFVVPNHLTEQWASEFLNLYPNAKLLVARRKDFETANRKKICARIATGDYDAVIIGHSQFERIPLSFERQERIIQEQIYETLAAINELKVHAGENFSIKQMEKTRKTLETKLEKLRSDERKDDVITFEQLGVDRLFVDESHFYKNLFLTTKMRNVAGLSTSEAQKSSDMFGKCRYLDEITGGRGVVFATGTPVSNSMTELYTVMRYLQYSTLQQKKLTHFDCWASTFGETTTAIELAPEGTGYRARTRFAKFFNYVTEGTFDSYLFQTLENKQRFISQIMTSKSPVRSCEDVDEQALSYAEIKALCAGNPLIKEKMDLDVQVAKLKVLKADHQSQKFRLQDKLLTKFPADIRETNAYIAGVKADAQLAAAHPQVQEGFCGMTIKGVTYDEKKTAGERLVLACSELPNAEEKVIGSYRGFELSLRFDTFRSEYQAILKGERRYPVALGTDPLGNIIRLDNSLNNFPERINSAENELTTLHQQQAAAQIEVEKPFPQEEELAEKSARLAELNAQLDVDEKNHEPEQDEEEQEDAPRRPSVLAALEEKSDKPEPVKPFRSYYDKDGDAR